MTSRHFLLQINFSCTHYEYRFFWKKITKEHFSASNDYLREKTGAIFKTTFFLAGKSYFYRDLRLLDRLQTECGLCNLSLVKITAAFDVVMLCTLGMCSARELPLIGTFQDLSFSLYA